MKNTLGIFGLIAACALCCSVPLIVTTLGAVVVSGAGVAFGPVAALAVTLTVGIGFWVKSRRRSRCSDHGCPKSSCHTV